ncbi:MAG TPA: ABC transporter permease subunit [Chitinispirillaceae bacterium]|nr:ABC transporter permease subunit [Chitinispirillaceae bacterium]
MRSFITIALNTFRETIRNKVLYNILLAAGVVLMLSMSFGDLSLFSRAQVIADFGLTTMSITGLLLAVFIGVGMLGREISSKTIYMIVTKPVSRESFIAGKFVGLFVVLVLNLMLIGAVFLISINLMDSEIRIKLGWAVLLIIMEMGIIVAASIFFSSFTTPTLAAIFTIGFYVSGHLNDLIGIGAEQKNNPLWSSALKIVYYVIPNLEHFNIRALVVYGLNIPQGYVFSAVCYGLLYIVLFLILSIMLFSGKDL